MECRYLLNVVRSGWWLLIGGLVLGLAVAAVATWSATPWYSSSIRLFLTLDSRGIVSPADTSDAYQTDLFAQERTDSYVRLLTGQDLAARVVDDLRLDLTPAQVAREVTATAVNRTVIIEATVTDTSARRAHDIAASLGRQFVQVASGPETPDGSSASMLKVTTVENPLVDSAPVRPDRAGNLQLGAALGLLVGLVLAQLRHQGVTVDRRPSDGRRQPDADGGIRTEPDAGHGGRSALMDRQVPPPIPVTRKRRYTYTADADRRRVPHG